ncbi:MAG: ABC transporter permease subunit [Solirubrobacterales bacterium]
MIDLLPAEFKRQIGRKGSFYGSMVWVGLFGLGVLIWAIASNSATGDVATDSGTGLLTFAVILSAIVVGATAGSYDVAEGTMRYLVLTGRPRWQLVIVRVLALPATVALIALPAIGLTLLATAIAGGTAPNGTELFDLFYSPLMSGMLYGTLSLAIGMFLKSNGVAIAVAVVLNFAGLLIAGLIYEYVSQDLANGFFPIVAGVVIEREATTGTEATLSLGTSIAILIVWLIALLGASLARVQRAEY